MFYICNVCNLLELGLNTYIVCGVQITISYNIKILLTKQQNVNTSRGSAENPSKYFHPRVGITASANRTSKQAPNAQNIWKIKTYFILDYHYKYTWGRHDHMVVGITTTIPVQNSAIHHLSCEFGPRSWRVILNTTLCDKVCQ
jgi:hypothetical protein